MNIDYSAPPRWIETNREADDAGLITLPWTVYAIIQALGALISGLFN
jgi:hypothetical protein